MTDTELDHVNQLLTQIKNLKASNKSLKMANREFLSIIDAQTAYMKKKGLSPDNAIESYKHKSPRSHDPNKKRTKLIRKNKN